MKDRGIIIMISKTFTLKNVFTFNVAHDLSLLTFDSPTNNINSCDSIVVGFHTILTQYNQNFVEVFKSFLSKNVPIVIDSTYELIEYDVLNFLNNFDNLSSITYFCIPRNDDYHKELKQKLLGKGLSLVERNFFIDCQDKYTPLFTKNYQQKHYLCLNGKTTPQRTAFVSMLAYYDLLSKGYVSFFGDTHVDETFDTRKMNDVYILSMTTHQKEKIDHGMKILNSPIILDVDIMNKQVSHKKKFNADYYNSVDFVVVNETNMYPDIFFCTEKTTKAIMLNKKIIVNGTKNFVKNLKDYYWKSHKKDISNLTDWNNLLYDKESDIITRCELVIDIIRQRVCNPI